MNSAWHHKKDAMRGFGIQVNAAKFDDLSFYQIQQAMKGIALLLDLPKPISNRMVLDWSKQNNDSGIQGLIKPELTKTGTKKNIPSKGEYMAYLKLVWIPELQKDPAIYDRFLNEYIFNRKVVSRVLSAPECVAGFFEKFRDEIYCAPPAPARPRIPAIGSPTYEGLPPFSPEVGAPPAPVPPVTPSVIPRTISPQEAEELLTVTPFEFSAEELEEIVREAGL